MKRPRHEGPITLLVATVFWILVAFIGKLL